MDLSSQQYCLRWNNYQTNLTSVFDQLLQSEAFVDVTLTTGGKSIKCHKVVLSACSPYFQQLFFDNPCQHPIVILKDISWNDMRFVVEYMYKGEINVTQDQLGPLLKAAEALKVRGLVDVNRDDDMQDTQIHPIPGPPGLIPRWSMPEDLRVIPGTTPKKRRRLTADECTPCPTPSPSPPDKSEVRVQSPSQSSATPSGPTSAPPPPHPSTSHSPAPSDNLSDIRPDIMEMIKEEQRAKMMEASQNWMAQNSTSTASGSSVPDHLSRRPEGSKVPTWSQAQLQEAIDAVIHQKMRFTQASTKYCIPKGTLYDNILGKSKRMQVLDDLGLTESQELAVLEYCCEISSMPYNRRTSRSLRDIIDFVAEIKRDAGVNDFEMSMRQGFKWWWAFTKKHSIISLFYENQGGKDDPKVKTESNEAMPAKSRRKSSPVPSLLNLSTSSKSSLHPPPASLPTISLPNSPLTFLSPFLGLSPRSRYSLPAYNRPPIAHSPAN